MKPPTTQEQLDMPSQVEESLEETVIEQEEEPVEETVIEQETTEAIEPEDMNEQMGIFEYSTYTNSRFGFSVEYPTSFTMGQPPTNNDGRRFFNEESTILAFGRNINILEENETIDKYYQQALSIATEPVAYHRLGDNWYVVSYTVDSNIIYEKAIINDEVIFIVNMTYPISQKEKYDEMVTRIATTFEAGSRRLG